jgi:hypothetical protein
MEDRDRVPQYRTIKRLQKKYLVRCNESLSHIILGNGVKPVSAMRRLETQISKLQKEMGKLTEREILVAETPSQGAPTTNARQQAAEIKQKKEDLAELIKEKQKELRYLELH